VGECSATAGETAAGSVQDDVRSDGHQMDGSSRVGDEEGGAFNTHPCGGGSAGWITLTYTTGTDVGPSTAKRVRHFGNAAGQVPMMRLARSSSVLKQILRPDVA
jgi:hypothetical protein